MNVSELLLVQACGYSTVGTVLGSAVLHLNPWGVGRTFTTELSTFTRVLSEARAAALAQLVAEAGVLGATGVVGVTLDMEERDLGGRVWEVVASGTAVAGGPAGRPFTSALSGQDLWLLRQSGYVPVAMLLGGGIYHLGRRGHLGALTAGFASSELDGPTQALTDARENALERMQRGVVGMRADGVVGVRIEMLPTPLGSHLVEVRASGTAVRAAVLPDPVPAPDVVLSLAGVLR